MDDRHVHEALHGSDQLTLVHASVLVAEFVEHPHAVLDAYGRPWVEQRFAVVALGGALQQFMGIACGISMNGVTNVMAEGECIVYKEFKAGKAK